MVKYSGTFRINSVLAFLLRFPQKEILQLSSFMFCWFKYLNFYSTIDNLQILLAHNGDIKLHFVIHCKNNTLMQIVFLLI